MLLTYNGHVTPIKTGTSIHPNKDRIKKIKGDGPKHEGVFQGPTPQHHFWDNTETKVKLPKRCRSLGNRLFVRFHASSNPPRPFKPN